jgi:hypothetical protein
VGLRIPAASTVTGPVNGRVVVASEPEHNEAASIVRIVDAAAGCATEIRLLDRIARRAIADPRGDGALVHLLDPGTRDDLGIWRVGVDGRIVERLIEPLERSLQAAVGMDRVWVTDLRSDTDGGRLAVQSCDPNVCVTRILNLASGETGVLHGEGQGPIVGFSGRLLVTWGACPGLPCPVLAWSSAAGSARTLAPAAAGAALSGDGRTLAVLLPGPDGGRGLVAIDVQSGVAGPAGIAGVDDTLLSGAAGSIAGLETAGSTVAIGNAGVVPAPRVLNDESATSVPPGPEVQP